VRERERERGGGHAFDVLTRLPDCLFKV